MKNHEKYHSDSYYYEIRSKVYRSEYQLAAQFIYLNRTCWNGLYRVNKNGAFNVPRGTKDTVIFPNDDFEKISKYLEKCEIINADFQDVIDNTDDGDLIFVDPPYTVKHNYNGFLKYNEELFSWADQERLAQCLIKASARGVKLVVTNGDHDSVRDLYNGFGIHQIVSRHSIIAGDSKHRGKTTELVVRNF